MVKLKHCWIVTQIGVVVDIDLLIMDVLCGKIFGKIETVGFEQKLVW